MFHAISLKYLSTRDYVKYCKNLYCVAKPSIIVSAQMFSDGYFLMPHDWLTMLLADQVPVYTYELQHRGQHGYTNYYLDLGLDLPQAAKCKS